MVTIEFDACQAIIKGEILDPDTSSALLEKFTYVDRSDLFAKKYKNPNIQPKETRFFKPGSPFAGHGGSLPTGILPLVADILSDRGIGFQIVNNAPQIFPSSPDAFLARVQAMGKSPRPYQHEATQAALTWLRGVIKIPTGDGKTLVMAYFISHFPEAKIVVTADSVNLVNQLVRELSNYLDENVGIFGDGKKIIKRVTVMTNASACSRHEVLADADILICDEAHRVGPKLSSTINKYAKKTAARIGFTATALKDKEGLFQTAALGPIIYWRDETESIETGTMLTPEFYVIRVPDPKLIYPDAQVDRNTNAVWYPTPTGKPDPSGVYDLALHRNRDRNEIILDLAEAFYRSDWTFPGLIMVERIDAGNFFTSELAKRGIHAPYLYSKTEKEERDVILAGLENCTLKLAVGGRTFVTGLDLPLSFCILACGGTSWVSYKQRNGRFLRSNRPGKTRAILVDFHDEEEFYLETASVKRQKFMSDFYGVNPVELKVEVLLELLRNLR
jgi:superfamily II DNA or RNA helicase